MDDDMIRRKKENFRCVLALACALTLAIPVLPVQASEVNNLQNKTSNLKNQLDGLNQDLVAISDKISATQKKIDRSDNEVYRLEASLKISYNNEEKQYENMKTRIKYMYENGSSTMLTLLLKADSMADFLNKADFIENVTEYDRNMLENMVKVRKGIEEQEKDLKKQQKELADLKNQMNSEEQQLKDKADATSTDLADFNKKLKAARAEQARQEELKKKQAQQKVQTKSTQKTRTAKKSTANKSSTKKHNTKPSSNNTGGSTNTGSGTRHGNYVIPSGGLTPQKGRITYNGHTETYYSQRVLPGGGLGIPGRHIASDGTIRDSGNYIVLASDDYPKGTVVQTSLGPGKVYDTGSGKGNIDLYTDW